MMVFVLSFIVVGLAVLGLAIGLLLGRGPLQGSCGGNAVVRICGLCKRGARR